MTTAAAATFVPGGYDDLRIAHALCSPMLVQGLNGLMAAPADLQQYVCCCVVVWLFFWGGVNRIAATETKFYSTFLMNWQHFLLKRCIFGIFSSVVVKHSYSNDTLQNATF